MPKTQEVQDRKALLAITGFDGLEPQISYEGINPVFFNGLIEQLRSEGQGNLVSFLRSLVESGWIGLEDKHRLTTIANAVQGLTKKQWESEFWGASNNSDSPHVPFVLPQLDISTFTGREDELRHLEEILLAQQGEKVCSIVGLTGGGGIGKSALACHFATIHQDKFPDGVIGLRVDNKDVDTIAREFARQIGKPIDPDDDLEARSIMQELFASRRMLLIFDNAEEANIKVLRPGGNLCAVIVTTRNQNLPFSLDVSENDTIRLQSLSEKDALDLLKKILGESRIETALAAAQRVAQIVGRLPLALQVVGAALRGKPRSFETYADSLQVQKDQLKLLPRLRVRGDDELNVEASLNLSLESLQKEEIDFFACLSVCAEEGFAITTAMAAAGYEDEWEAEEFLDKLYELSLLNYTKTEQDRFVLHPLVQEYAKSLAQERDLLTIAKERHAQFFVEWLQSENLEDVTVVAEVAINLDDVILAAEWLQNHETDTAQRKMENYQFALQLQPLFEQYGYWKKAITLMVRFQSWAEQFEDWNAVVKYQMHEARYCSFEEQFERAEEILSSAQINLHKIADRDIRKRREAKVLNVLGGVFQKQAKTEEAIQVFRDEILIEEEIGNDKSLGIVCNRLGNLLQSQDKLEEAQQAFERQIAIARFLGDNSQLARGLNCLGELFLKQGKLEEAQEVWQQKIFLIKDSGEFRKAVSTAMILGGKFYKLGNLTQALQIFLIAADLHKDFESEGLVFTLRNLGKDFFKQNNFEEALTATRAAIQICLDTNNKNQLATSNNVLGKILQAQGDLEKAEQAFERQIEIGEAINNQSQLESGLNCLGGVLRQQGKLEQAQQTFEKGIEIAEAFNNESQLVIELNCLGRVLQQQSKLKEAQQAFEKEIEIAETLNNKSSLVIGLNCLGRVLQQQGKLELAQQVFERGIEIDSILNDKSSRYAWTLHNLGRICKSKGEFEKAESILKQSREIFEDEKNLPDLAKVMNTLGSVLEKQQKWDEAEKILRQSYDLAFKLGDKLGQAIIANSLGQITAHQGGEKNFQLAQMYFRQSIKLGQELDNKYHLAKAHTAMGQAFLAHDFLEQAVDELTQGFEIDESLSNIRGLKIVTPNLTYTLSRFGKREEALAYCERALTIAPNYSGFLQLYEKIQAAISKGIQQTYLKTGFILYIRRNKKDNLRWGRIAPDDGSLHITFNENFIGSQSVSKLSPGALVEVEVKKQYGKLYATQIRLIEDEEDLSFDRDFDAINDFDTEL